MERIGDRLAAVERKRRAEPAVDLGDQHRPPWGPGAVQLGQDPQPAGVGGFRESESDIGLTSFHNHLAILAGS